MKINGAGCSLVDNLYSSVDFSSRQFTALRSHQEGDGGLIVGGLVFAEDLAEFAGAEYSEVLRLITRQKTPDSWNLGGPAIIPLVHAAQLLAHTSSIETAFFGVRGTDDAAERIMELLKGIPVHMRGYRQVTGATPTTDVFSDPRYADGQGERTFVNRIGVAGSPEAAQFDDAFFHGDIVFFGGTGLVPPQHDTLSDLTRRAAHNGALVVVTTVFDFRNHKRNPHGTWPLVDDYQVVDLIITDREEALRITGAADAEHAAEWFIRRGAGAAVVTQGTSDVIIRQQSPRFLPAKVTHLPVSKAAEKLVRTVKTPRDTTGCGDNFVGGVLASIAAQMEQQRQPVDLTVACACGVVSGGFAATYLGGLFREAHPGEKRDAIAHLWKQYRRQTSGFLDLPADLPVGI